MPEPAEGRNLLSQETSPYLLQHKDNPVHWRPWGDAALAQAAATRRPILLSIGYAACHWCHVMAHESFENPMIAAVMNELFVNIKVDREERPDIDQIYMAALHALGEAGGWPLTMFLTPAGEPVWGGTYFPPTARYGRPGFADVLRSVAAIFADEPGRVETNRAALRQFLARPPRIGREPIGRRELDEMARRLATVIDPVLGGPRGAPKFPNASVLEMLWRGADRMAEPGLERLVLTTLEAIARGGIRDHVGGGFARYTVDERWLVPHFEKMLYDNAQLLDLFTLAHQKGGMPLFREAATELVEWLARDMMAGDGRAFASSLDADSEGHEGRYYVWTPETVAAALPAGDGAFFSQHFDITEEGNWEGVSIPNRLRNPVFDDAAWQPIRAGLEAARRRRVPPGRDDKVLADWNGMMIAALCHAGDHFGRADWIALAEGAFRFIAESMSVEGRLGHSWRAGRLTLPGLASDHASMIRAALALAEVTREPAYVDHALAWSAVMEHHYRDAASGGYFLTAADATDLIVRPRSTLDEATPNPNGVMADNLVILASLTGDARWRERAHALFAGLSVEMDANGFGHAALFNALDRQLAGAEIVVIGRSEAARSLSRAALGLPWTARSLTSIAAADGLGESHPAAAKAKHAPDPSAFVCLGSRCSLPVATPAALLDTYAAMRRE